MDRPPLISAENALEVQRRFGTPTFLYDQGALEGNAARALAFPNPYGLTVRYAMKANPCAAVLRVLHGRGLHIDASSGFEVHRARRAGIPAEHILLTAQEPPADLAQLVREGVLFNACSLRQLSLYGQAFPGREVSIRVNPGLGSGHSNRTNVGGPSASFGIWHEHLDKVIDVARRHSLSITRLHSHIGSGGDPQVWQHCARLTLAIARRLPDVQCLNLGGGFKVGRMPDEPSTDLQTAGAPVATEMERFAAEDGRRLHMEIEPGTLLAANAGVLVCTVVDVVDTGPQGYAFVKIDAGMTEILRPSLYGAQHPIAVVPRGSGERASGSYLVVGHCCESGDILTPQPGNPDGLAPRRLTQAQPGDVLCIGGAGAYCAAMPASNYNSFPAAAEVLRSREGALVLARRRQTLEHLLANELLPDSLS